MSAIADDGQTVGYVRRTDLDGDVPSSPEEALAQQEARGDSSRQIPVYESDGVTVIGTFTIG